MSKQATRGKVNRDEFSRRPSAVEQPDNNAGLASFVGRPVPHDFDAEMRLLGSIVLNPELIDDVVMTLKLEDFYDTRHQVLFRHMVAMHDAGKRIDDVLLVDRLKKADEFELIGGVGYLSQIVNAVPNASSCFWYADIVLEKAQKRRIIAATGQAITDAMDDMLDSKELTAKTQTDLAIIAERGISNQECATVHAAMNQSLAALEARIGGTVEGLPTGIVELDQRIRLKAGELTIIAARPSMGKSALAGNIAVYAAKHATVYPIVFFSLEMSQIELSNRWLCAEAQVSFTKMLSGQYLSCTDRDALTEACARMANMALFIDDNPNRTVSTIAAQARRIKRRNDDKLGLIVIDYLQLVTPDNTREPRQEQVAKMSRRLKLLARELEVPVVCLAQMNRQVEQAADCVPKLSQLRESGAIEQDADNVIFVHRPKWFKREVPKDGSAEDAELYLAKARNSSTCKIDVQWLGRFQQFRNPAEPHQEAYTDGGWDGYSLNNQPGPQQTAAEQGPQQQPGEIF